MSYRRPGVEDLVFSGEMKQGGLSIYEPIYTTTRHSRFPARWNEGVPVPMCGLLAAS